MDHESFVQTTLRNLLRNHGSHNVSLQCLDGKLTAHQEVLSVRCSGLHLKTKFMRRRFFLDIDESVETTEAWLEYIYIGNETLLENTSPQTIAGLCRLAVKYNMRHLEKICYLMASRTSSVPKVAELLFEASQEPKLEHLQLISGTLLVQNYCEFVESKDVVHRLGIANFEYVLSLFRTNPQIPEELLNLPKNPYLEDVKTLHEKFLLFSASTNSKSAIKKY